MSSCPCSEHVVEVNDDAVVQAAESSKTSLFERVGGGPAVKAVVEEFYTRILDDRKLEKFFVDVDMALLKKHQYMFMEIAFTKIPDDLDVAQLMKDKHQRLFADPYNLNETHFDLVAKHLVNSMKSLRVSQNLIDEAIGVIAPLRGVFEQGAKDAAHAQDVQEHIADVAHASKEQLEATVSNNEQHTDTLFMRLGGGPAVRAVVAEFYKRLVEDVQLAKFFDGVDIEVLKKHQYTVMELAFTDSFGDIDVPALMIEKHQRLFGMGLNGKHFDMVAGHLVLAMEHLGVSAKLIEEVIAIIGPLRIAFETGASNYEKSKQETAEEKKDEQTSYWDA